MDCLLKCLVLLLVSQNINGDILVQDLSKNHIVSALNQIVKESFSNSHVHIIYAHKNISFADDISSILSAINMNSNLSKITLENVEKPSVIQSFKANAAIISVDSVEKFLTFELKNVQRSGKFLIFFTKEMSATEKDLETILTKLWQLNIVNVGVLIESDDVIELKTFWPFGLGRCGDTTPRSINEYVKNVGKWKTLNFFPQKLKNLHNCMIKFGAFVSIPTVMLKATGNEVYGSEADMIHNIGKIMKFTANYSIFPIESGVVDENGTATGLMKEVMDKKVDAVHGFLSLLYSRAKYLSPSKAFAEVPLAMVIPPGDLVPPFEKLFYPFTKEVWYMVVAMYAIVFFIIAMLKIFSKTAYNFLIGRNIRNPYLSMLIVCLGFTQPKLPNRNFSRFTLMNFMLFWLVVRTCYQGILFNLLKKVI
jgi:hypothetical protein